MSPDNDNNELNATEILLQHLKQIGFFDQMTQLETSLTLIVKQMETSNQAAIKQHQESENIATHTLAIEAVLSGLLKKYPLDGDDLSQELKQQADALTNGKDANPQIEAIARRLLNKS